jgi:hypothetical protein
LEGFSEDVSRRDGEVQMVELSHCLADGILGEAEREGKSALLREEAWKESLEKVVSGLFSGQKPLEGSATVRLIHAKLEQENGSEVFDEALGSTGRAVRVKAVVQPAKCFGEVLGPADGVVVNTKQLLAGFGLTGACYGRWHVMTLDSYTHCVKQGLEKSQQWGSVHDIAAAPTLHPGSLLHAGDVR